MYNKYIIGIKYFNMLAYYLEILSSDPVESYFAEFLYLQLRIPEEVWHWMLSINIRPAYKQFSFFWKILRSDYFRCAESIYGRN